MIVKVILYQPLQKFFFLLECHLFSSTKSKSSSVCSVSEPETAKISRCWCFSGFFPVWSLMGRLPCHSKIFCKKTGEFIPQSSDFSTSVLSHSLASETPHLKGSSDFLRSCCDSLQSGRRQGDRPDVSIIGPSGRETGPRAALFLKRVLTKQGQKPKLVKKPILAQRSLCCVVQLKGILLCNLIFSIHFGSSACLPCLLWYFSPDTEFGISALLSPPSSMGSACRLSVSSLRAEWCQD